MAKKRRTPKQLSQEQAALLAKLHPAVEITPLIRPCLLLVAMQAELVRPELRSSLSRDLGDHLSTVELDCGHMVYWDAFDETVAALRGFLTPPV